jgi:hypothetical protein
VDLHIRQSAHQQHGSQMNKILRDFELMGELDHQLVVIRSLSRISVMTAPATPTAPTPTFGQS